MARIFGIIGAILVLGIGFIAMISYGTGLMG